MLNRIWTRYLQFFFLSPFFAFQGKPLLRQGNNFLILSITLFSMSFAFLPKSFRAQPIGFVLFITQYCVLNYRGESCAKYLCCLRVDFTDLYSNNLLHLTQEINNNNKNNIYLYLSNILFYNDLEFVLKLGDWAPEITMKS